MTLLDPEKNNPIPAVDRVDLTTYVRDQRRTLPGWWFWLLAEVSFRHNWQPTSRTTKEYLRIELARALGVPEELRSKLVAHASFRKATAFVQQSFVTKGLAEEATGGVLRLTKKGRMLAEEWYSKGWDSWCRYAEHVRREIDK